MRLLSLQSLPIDQNPKVYARYGQTKVYAHHGQRNEHIQQNNLQNSHRRHGEEVPCNENWSAPERPHQGNSDEKNFDQDQKLSRRNIRWTCRRLEEVSIAINFSVMTLGAVSCEGDVMLPYFFEAGLKVNKVD